MARHLRIEYPGAWYHVMNRASDQQKIFYNDAHYNYFLDLLAEAHGKYKVEIHAYCLMESHYHLLIRTPIGGLGKAMRHINGNYTQQFNRLNNRSGSLFNGRYKAILVDADKYLLPLSRHIHLYPEEGNERGDIDSKPEEYQWSSCKFYTDPSHKPWWLFCDEILTRLELQEKSDYIQYLAEGMNQKLQNLNDLSGKSFILGDKTFVRGIIHENNKHFSGNTPENIKIRKILLPTVDCVIAEVAQHFNIDPIEIIHFPSRSIGNLPRQISLYLSVKLTGEKNKDIANYFKNISYKGVSQASCRMNAMLNHNEALRALVELIEKTISNSEYEPDFFTKGEKR